MDKISLMHDLINVLSLQENVTLRKRMIRAEYRKVNLLLYTEEKRYLEKIENESEEIFQQLKESKDSMCLKRTHLRGIYEELMEMCRKPDRELIQVRAEGWSHSRCCLDTSIFSLPSNMCVG